MKNRSSIIVIVLLFAGMFSPIYGADKSKAMGEAKSQAVQDEQMARMQKLTSPGENHKYLEPLIGSWKHTGKWWMAANSKPEEFKGVNENKWILGNRFVQQDVKGEMMGQPFQGMGITGYDNIKGQYTSIWLDNMATGMMTGSAKYDMAAKTFAEGGTFSDPMTGEKNKSFRSVWKIIDNDHYTYEMFTQGPDAKEYKSMAISYERVK